MPSGITPPKCRGSRICRLHKHPAVSTTSGHSVHSFGKLHGTAWQSDNDTMWFRWQMATLTRTTRKLALTWPKIIKNSHGKLNITQPQKYPPWKTQPGPVAKASSTKSFCFDGSPRLPKALPRLINEMASLKTMDGSAILILLNLMYTVLAMYLYVFMTCVYINLVTIIIYQYYHHYCW